MLANLKVKNLAVIKNLEVKFYTGLNVFTGETGSGKSVMLKAISFILGARCSKDIIRFGEESAIVEAVFKNLNSKILKFLKKNLEIEVLNDEIYIKRTIFKDGKTIASVNGVNVSINNLKKLGEKLVYLNEQGSGQHLVDADNSLKIVDNFAKINGLLLKYRESFVNLNNVIKQLKQIDSKIEEKNKKLEVLSTQITEIESLNLKLGEDDTITEKLKLIKNSEIILENLNFAQNILSGDDRTDGILNNLENVVKKIEKIVIYNSKLKLIFEKFKSLFFELQELVFDLNDVKNDFNFQPNQMEFLENRLSEISKIKRKYGPSLLDVENELKKMKLELNKIQNYSLQKEKLIKIKETELAQFKNLLLTISKKRQETSIKISASILQELKFLEMKDANFKIELKKHKANLNGLEEINFLISSNLGEPLKPISKVASGGELSRIMLAIVSVISNEFKPLTLIFDEIDSGVSGITANKMGLKLKQLSTSTQIICITHLAQIAAIADENFKIVKTKIGDRVSSDVIHLNSNEKIKEIARIIGGSQVNDLTLKLAAEMIKH